MLTRPSVTRALAAFALSLGLVRSAHAQYTQTVAEYNGPPNGPTGSTYLVGTFTGIPTSGILSAVINGQFGNSQTSSTALQNVFLDGIQIASCATTSDFCWMTGPQGFSFTFSPSQYGIFSDGVANLTVTQTGCCTIRLGPTTLIVRAAVTATPEPASLAMLSTGLVGLAGAVIRRRRSV